MTDDEPFNPLDRTSPIATLPDVLIERKPRPLKSLKPFEGNGIYALFYGGSFPPYRALVEFNKGADMQVPIFVGSALAAAGAGQGAESKVTARRALYRRLRQHAESIRAATNLDISDFSYRLLVLDEIWIPIGESMLMASCSPLWNLAINGFAVGKPTRQYESVMASRWDVLHPGRAWATKCRLRVETVDEIAGEVITRWTQDPCLVRRAIGQVRPADATFPRRRRKRTSTPMELPDPATQACNLQ